MLTFTNNTWGKCSRYFFTFTYVWFRIQEFYILLFDFYLKQLGGTFHFVFILAVPVDKDGNVSPNISLHVPSTSFPTRRLFLWEESRRAAPETDLQLATEASGFQPVQTPALFCQISRKNFMAGIKKNY